MEAFDRLYKAMAERREQRGASCGNIVPLGFDYLALDCLLEIKTVLDALEKQAHTERSCENCGVGHMECHTNGVRKYCDEWQPKPPKAEQYESCSNCALLHGDCPANISGDGCTWQPKAEQGGDDNCIYYGQRDKHCELRFSHRAAMKERDDLRARLAVANADLAMKEHAVKALQAENAELKRSLKAQTDAIDMLKRRDGVIIVKQEG